MLASTFRVETLPSCLEKSSDDLQRAIEILDILRKTREVIL